LHTHRDVFANRLREFDKCKSIRDNGFINKKIRETERTASTVTNFFGPIDKERKERENESLYVTGSNFTQNH